jgi:hypothetical protein
VIGLVRMQVGDSSATRVRAGGDVGGGSRLPADAVIESGHRFTRRQRTNINSRLNRMDWASVESLPRVSPEGGAMTSRPGT